MKTHWFFESVRGAEEEFRVAAVAVARYQELVQQNPSSGEADGVELQWIRRCRVELEPTFVIRAFSEFEVALRDAWGRMRTTRPKMEDLLNSIASKFNVGVADTANAHRVREYRNDLVHSRKPNFVLDLSECRSYLCKFLAYVPYEHFLKPRKLQSVNPYRTPINTSIVN